MTLYLLKFNNYYNRIVKRINNINDVNENILAAFEGITNFNSNDGITTKQVVNYNGDLPDYVVVTSPDSQINSLWFVIESVRTRGQQFEMTLYRDVISEWYDDIVEAPMFIEKATVGLGDTAIFNNENMTYNQIKTSENLIKDASKCPWIVGYLARNHVFSEPISFSLDPGVVAEYADFDEYPYSKYTADNPVYLSEMLSGQKFLFNYYISDDVMVARYTSSLNDSGAFSIPYDSNYTTTNYEGVYYQKGQQYTDGKGFYLGYALTGFDGLNKVSQRTKELAASINWKGYNYNDANYNGIINTTRATITSQNSKIIKVGNEYYTVKTVFGKSKVITAEIPETSTLGGKMAEITSQIPTYGKRQPVYEMQYYATPLHFEFELTSVDEFTITIPSQTNRTQCNDAPYDIFAIPFGEMWLGNVSPSRINSPEVSMKLARVIQLKADKALYDLQLLPFCPLPDDLFTEEISGNTKLPRILLDQLEEKEYTPCKFENANRSMIFWLKSANFTKYSNINIPVAETAVEFKVENECDTYRLCSPNWNGTFEFSATKNMGVNGFRIDCTYKPVNPYIRIAPMFNGLYGTITDDARGLICGGDFSLSQISDAWIQYQQQNSNFQQIFDRQIENMEINNSIQRTLEGWNVATGTLSGVTTGAMTGAMVGGGWGATIGGVVGGATSLGGGIADMILNEQLRSEALDYTKDQFGYRLGNIRAIPQSLTKVSSFNPNNKIFPILEFYTCTEIEKEALRNKLKYNGMTVMRIGTIKEFLQDQNSYVKGKLIRLETLYDDFHVVNKIADELNKGVFI